MDPQARQSANSNFIAQWRTMLDVLYRLSCGIRNWEHATDDRKKLKRFSKTLLERSTTLLNKMDEPR